MLSTAVIAIILLKTVITRGANSMDFFIEFKFEFEFKDIRKSEFEFEFLVFNFSSSSSSSSSGIFVRVQDRVREKLIENGTF